MIGLDKAAHKTGMTSAGGGVNPEPRYRFKSRSMASAISVGLSESRER